jgi:hypothetical protein
MSNQTGDRYSCSNPNCGCQLEIQRPCGMVSSSANVASGSLESRATSGTLESDSMLAKNRELRADAPVSTVGDYGSQGATGEGLFGTSGSGRSATMSGRYDTESMRVRDDAPATQRSGGDPSLRCFCGHEMRQVGSSQSGSSARAASH